MKIRFFHVCFAVYCSLSLEAQSSDWYYCDKRNSRVIQAGGCYGQVYMEFFSDSSFYYHSNVMFDRVSIGKWKQIGDTIFVVSDDEKTQEFIWKNYEKKFSGAIVRGLKIITVKVEVLQSDSLKLIEEQTEPIYFWESRHKDKSYLKTAMADSYWGLDSTYLFSEFSRDVYAVDSGYVSVSDEELSYLVLETYNGIVSYQDVVSIYVKDGDKVEKGQLIGSAKRRRGKYSIYLHLN